MRILPVSLGINNLNNKDGCKRLTPANYPRMKTSFIQDTVTFGGGITTPNGLKELAKNGHLKCIWCGKSMLHSTEMDALGRVVEQRINNRKSIVGVISQLIDYCPPKSVFGKLLKKITAYSVAYPEERNSLSGLIQRIYPEAEKRLVGKQFLCFQKINKLKNMLPEDVHASFEKLLLHSKKRVLKIPYVSEYSAKEFFYQLCKISKNISSPELLREMVSTSSVLTLPILKEDKPNGAKSFLLYLSKHIEVPPSIRKISPNDSNWKTKVKLAILDEISKIAEKEYLVDVIKLCDTTKDKVLGKATVVQFKNQAFNYKIDEILERVSDKDLVKKFKSKLPTLPSSHDNANAFVVKYRYASDQKIFSEIMKNLQTTVEHEVPILRNTSSADLKKQAKKDKIKKRKGKNEIGNWALAHHWCNDVHGSKNIKGENFPFSKEAGIQYFQTLIKDANEGRLLGSSVIQMAKNYFLETGIKINLKGLKYTSEY